MIQAIISGKQYKAKEGSLRISKQIKQRSSCSFVIEEEAGPYTHFIDGQSVLIQTIDGENLFAGYIASAEESLDCSLMIHTIRCTDKHYGLDKRLCVGSYKNALAGDVVGDLFNQYLKDEGVKAEYVYQKEQFLAGTLTNVTTNPIDGSLELQSAGTPLDFTCSFPTLNNTVVTPSGVTLTPIPALKFLASNTNIYGINSFIYWKIWTGSLAITSGDQLVYDIWIDPNNPLIVAAVDGQCTDGSTIRDIGNKGIVDQNGVPAHPDSDLTSYAKAKWYTRTFSLNLLAGKILAFAQLAQEGNNKGNYLAYIKKAFIKDSNGNIKLTIFDGTLQANALHEKTIDYAIDLSITSVYVDQGTATSFPIALDSVGIVKNGSVTYDGSSTYLVQVSLDGGSIWQPIASSGSIPFLQGMTVTGKTLLFKVTLQANQADPLATPVVSFVRGTVTPTYKPTLAKTDIQQSYGPNFTGTGTITNLTTNTSGLFLQNAARNWDDGVFSNQTLYGAVSPSQSVGNGQLWLACGNNGQATSKLDFAGQHADFIASFDVYIEASTQAGFKYRTTFWDNQDATYAYMVEIGTSQIALRRGTNSSTSSYVDVKVVVLSLPSGSWHTVKAVIIGNRHQFYIDGILAIDVTDNTFLGAGYTALRNRNLLTSTYKMLFDNFSIVSAATGTWVSNTLAVAGPVASSKVLYDASIPAGSSLVIEATSNGGTNWQPLTNGGALPLAIGDTSKNIQLRATFNSTEAVAAVLKGIDVFITSRFQSVGSRLSPAIDLSEAVQAGNSNISWTSEEPTGTDIQIEASLDNGAHWQQLTNNQPIPGIYHRPGPYLDLFDTYSSGDYEVFGSWVWDVPNKVLVGQGEGTIAYNDFSVASCYVEGDFNQAGGGLLLNYQDDQNYYYVAFQGNLWSVHKKVAGTAAQLGLSGNIVWTEPHRVCFQNQNNKLTLIIDGIQVFQFDDSATSPLPAGKAGVICLTSVQVLSLRIQPIGDILAGKTLLLRQTLTSDTPTDTPHLLSLTTGMRSEKIDAGARIPEITFNYSKVADAYDQLANLSNAWYNIDENSMLWFKELNSTAAPLIASPSLFLKDIDVENTNPKYRNRQYAFTKNTTTTQTYTGRGGTKTWTMAYSLAEVPTVLLNGVVQTIGIRGVDTGKSFYWSKGDPVISLDDSLSTTFNDVITVSYKGLYDFIYMAEDSGEIAIRRQLEGNETTGFVEDIENVDAETEEAAAFYANSLLERYSQESRSISFAIPPESAASGGLLKEGQLLFIKLPEHGLSHLFLIEAIDIELAGYHYWYTVKASYGASSDNWVKFFEKLLNPKREDTSSAASGAIAQILVNYGVQHDWSGEVVVTQGDVLFPQTTLYPSTTLFPGG